MLNIEISTYWNVETLGYVLNAVAGLMAGAGFAGLLKMVFLFALCIGIFSYVNKQLELFVWFINALVFVTVLNMPIARVTITDRTNIEGSQTVDNVPFVLAVIAQTSSLTFGFLTRTYETAFGVPDELGLQKGDVGFAHRILKNINNSTVREPGLRADLMQFFKECTLFDIKDGVVSIDDIFKSTSTWNILFSKTSPARFVTYDTMTPSPQLVTCRDAAAVLKGRLETSVIAEIDTHAKSVFSRTSDDTLAANMYVAAVGTSYDWIVNSSQKSSDAAKQAMFNNLWRDAGTELPSLLNDPTRVAEVNALMGQAQATNQANTSNSVVSLMAQEAIPHVRNWVEAILYAMFPVIVIMMIVVSTEAAKKVLGGYFMALCWIGLWPVLFAVVNHLSMMLLQHKLKAMDLAAGVGYQMMDAFDATITDEQSMLGYMVIIVPFLAAGIIKMAQGGFMSVADKMVGNLSSAGTSVGGSIGNGNIGMGQASMDTVSANTTNMHKHDTGMSLRGGTTEVQMANGSIARTSPGGNVTVDRSPSQNNMGAASMQVDRRSDAASSKDLHKTETVQGSDQDYTRHSDNATFTKSTHAEKLHSYYQNKGYEKGRLYDGGVAKNATDSQVLTDQTSRAGTSHRDTSVKAGEGGQFTIEGSTAGRGGSYTPTNGQPKGGKQPGPTLERAGATKDQVEEANNNYRNQAPGGNNQPPSNSGNTPRVAASGSVNLSKDYTAGYGQVDTNLVSAADLSTVGTTYTFNDSASLRRTEGAGEDSRQQDSVGVNSSRGKGVEKGNVQEVTTRNEYGAGQRTSVTDTNTQVSGNNLLADSKFVTRMANANGLSVQALGDMTNNELVTMAENFAASEGVGKQARTMPPAQSGQQLPSSENLGNKKDELKQKFVPNVDLDKVTKANDAKTGVKGVPKVHVQPPTVPATAAMADSAIANAGNPDLPDSTGARAKQVDKAVTHYVPSPDTPPGKGPVAPSTQIGKMIRDDSVDTVDKIKNMVKGKE